MSNNFYRATIVLFFLFLFTLRVILFLLKPVKLTYPLMNRQTFVKTRSTLTVCVYQQTIKYKKKKNIERRKKSTKSSTNYQVKKEEKTFL